MADFNTTVGQRNPSMFAELSDANGPINLVSGVSSVTWYMSKNGVSKIAAGACTIVDAANGIVRYDWAANDVNTPGMFEGQFQINFSNGKTQRVPDEDYKYINIQRAA